MGGGVSDAAYLGVTRAEFPDQQPVGARVAHLRACKTMPTVSSPTDHDCWGRALKDKLPLVAGLRQTQNAEARHPGGANFSKSEGSIELADNRFQAAWRIDDSRSCCLERRRNRGPLLDRTGISVSKSYGPRGRVIEECQSIILV